MAEPTYTWHDQWARIPGTVTGRQNGRTHGVCVTGEGTVIVFHQAENGLLTFDPDGQLISAVGGERWMGAHGLTKIEEDGEERLWLVDQDSTEVVKVDLDGNELLRVPRPDHPSYRGQNEGAYVPTWAAQDPVTGRIWVADGYGSSLLHRYSADGTYEMTLDGTEGAGRFREPHGIQFTTGAAGPELFVTDRANHRIVTYSGEGTFLRSSTQVHSPCNFDFLDDHVVVPELYTGVKILDLDSLEVVTEIGKNQDVSPRPDGEWWPPICPEGWPNLAGTNYIRVGVFNSPHAACFSPDGDLYVVEWIIGGRITKLQLNPD
jgi:DNA-binding beta-propeller fold protein YncE